MMGEHEAKRILIEVLENADNGNHTITPAYLRDAIEQAIAELE